MKESIKENLEEEKMEQQEESNEDVKIEEPKKEEETKFEKATDKAKKIEKHLEEMDEPKKRKKWIIPVAIIGIILVIAIFCSTIFALVNINNEKIVSGISIAQIDVSGLSKEEAIAKLNTIYEEKKQKEISLFYEDYENTLNPSIMEVNYEIEKAVEEAYSIGKGDNIFINNYQILFALIYIQRSKLWN